MTGERGRLERGIGGPAPLATFPRERWVPLVSGAEIKETVRPRVEGWTLRAGATDNRGLAGATAPAVVQGAAFPPSLHETDRGADGESPSPDRSSGPARSVEPSSCGGTLPPPAFPGPRAEVMGPRGSTNVPGNLSPSMGGSKPNAVAAGRPHRADPAGGTRYQSKDPARVVVPLVVAAVALVALLVLVWLRMDVVQRLQFVALTCACFEIAGLIVLVIEARDEDRGAVLDRWGR